MLAIQPLDLLPPCAVTFRDYALAVLRSEQVANPTDPSGYRALMLDCFIERGILTEADRDELLDAGAGIRASGARRLSPSRCYRRLARRRLPLPRRQPRQAPHSAQCGSRRHRGRPSQQVDAGPPIAARADHRAVYLARGAASRRRAVRPLRWRTDDDALRRDHGARSERQPDPLVAQARQRKRGYQCGRCCGTGRGREAARRSFSTPSRRASQAGTIGETVGGELGLLERASPPFGVERVDGTVRFALAPHFSIRGDAENDNTGDRQWQISF